MAGDFVMIQHATPRKPEVLQLAIALRVPKAHAFGLCVMAWQWFDEQTEDGHAKSVTPEMFDAEIGHAGLAAGLAQVGWLEISEDGISVPMFDRHMGESAKTRANARKRKEKQRQPPQEYVTERSHKKCDKSVTKEEKRREKKRRENTGGAGPEKPGGAVAVSEGQAPPPEPDQPPTAAPAKPVTPEVPEAVRDIWQQWLAYKRERGESYKPTGLHQATCLLCQRVEQLGAAAVKQLLMTAMASGWTGWDHRGALGSTAADARRPPPTVPMQQRPVVSVSRPMAAAEATA